MMIFNRVPTKQIMVAVMFGGLFFSCGSSADESSEKLLDDADTVKSSVLNVAGELFSVPSPIQTALLLKKSGVLYDKEVLSPTNKVNTFSTDQSRALNLGIYGADLGYVSLYNQTQDALNYLASLKQISDKLGLSAAFDEVTMTRIQKNITDKDSMMVLVALAYRGCDAYLKNSQRTDISSLILTGGWIESMHFAISAYRKKPSDEIRYRIAEQKQALNSLVKILHGIDSEEVNKLRLAMTELAKEYQMIQFKYTFVEPTHDTIKKLTYINSISEVIVSDEQLTKITRMITDIRNKIINVSQS